MGLGAADEKEGTPMRLPFYWGLLAATFLLILKP
jgi:hypothetical protein